MREAVACLVHLHFSQFFTSRFPKKKNLNWHLNMCSEGTLGTFFCYCKVIVMPNSMMFKHVFGVDAKFYLYFWSKCRLLEKIHHFQIDPCWKSFYIPSHFREVLMKWHTTFFHFLHGTFWGAMVFFSPAWFILRILHIMRVFVLWVFNMAPLFFFCLLCKCERVASRACNLILRMWHDRCNCTAMFAEMAAIADYG